MPLPTPTTENLTLKAGIVRPLPSVQPVPGHDVVLFKRPASGGHVYHSTLGPNQEFRPSLFARWLHREELVAYAVSRDPDLRHELNREVTTLDQGGSFTLRCLLTLCVSSSRQLVEALAQDPLLRVEQHVADVLGGTAARVNWLTVDDTGTGLGPQLLSSDALEASQRGVSNLTILRDFALRKGLELRNVDVEVRFSAEYGELIRAEQAARRKRRLRELEFGDRVQLQDQDAQIKLRAAGHDTVLGVFQRIRINLEELSSTGTPHSRPDVVSDLLQLVNEAQTLVSGAKGEVPQLAALTGHREVRKVKRIQATRARPVHPAENHINPVFEILATLPGGPNDHDRLLAAVLHLVADLLLADEVDGSILEARRADLENRIDALPAPLQNQKQHALLSSLLNLRNLRAGAGGGQ